MFHTYNPYLEPNSNDCRMYLPIRKKLPANATICLFLQANEGKDVLAKLLRRGSAVELSVIPHKWTGQGLLGCHMRPLM